MLFWLIIALILVWPFSQFLSPGYRLEATLASVGVVLFSLWCIEFIIAWRENRSLRQRIEAQAAVNLDEKDSQEELKQVDKPKKRENTRREKTQRCVENINRQIVAERKRQERLEAKRKKREEQEAEKKRQEEQEAERKRQEDQKKKQEATKAYKKEKRQRQREAKRKNREEQEAEKKRQEEQTKAETKRQKKKNRRTTKRKKEAEKKEAERKRQETAKLKGKEVVKENSDLGDQAGIGNSRPASAVNEGASSVWNGTPWSKRSGRASACNEPVVTSDNACRTHMGSDIPSTSYSSGPLDGMQEESRQSTSTVSGSPPAQYPWHPSEWPTLHPAPAQSESSDEEPYYKLPTRLLSSDESDHPPST